MEEYVDAKVNGIETKVRMVCRGQKKGNIEKYRYCPYRMECQLGKIYLYSDKSHTAYFYPIEEGICERGD